MPVLETKGAASAQGFGLTLQQGAVNYIEDVFSTWLYTGNGSTQTITNGIDLAGKGGLVWTKNRTSAFDNYLYDTARGVNKVLLSNNTIDQQSLANTLTSFNSNGFTLGGSDYGNITPGNAAVSWTFRKQPKFFDIVTFSTNASGGGTFTHNLGSTPGFIIVKSTSNSDQWTIYHQSLGTSGYMYLNTNAANNPITGFWNVSSTSVTFANGYGPANASMVAYLFAHNAGGFGLTGADNVISCGSYTGNGSATGPVVTLGYEPQWVMVKRATGGLGNWTIVDNMRGMSQTSSTLLYPNNTSRDSVESPAWIVPNATGFQLTTSDSGVNGNTNTFIYIAIRRGPMKVPTTATSVFRPNDPGPSGGSVITTNFPVDAQIVPANKDSTHDTYVMSRLQGVDTSNSGSAFPYLLTNSSDAEATSTTVTNRWSNTGFTVPISTLNLNAVFYSFRRAPGFFDVVCWTGTGGTLNLTHNLGVAPELYIVKKRSATGSWFVYAAPLGYLYELEMNLTQAAQGPESAYWGAAPTSTTFRVTAITGSASAATYVAYLFATCPGVSKVGSYTGTGALQTINCGFTAGSRFILIKRTDSTGDWYVWDSSRGLGVLTEPYLLLNSTAAEVGNTNWVDTTATGFQVTAAVGNNVNINGASYIALAIA
jgi:hypothetical protein